MIVLRDAALLECVRVDEKFQPIEGSEFEIEVEEDAAPESDAPTTLDGLIAEGGTGEGNDPLDAAEGAVREMDAADLSLEQRRELHMAAARRLTGTDDPTALSYVLTALVQVDLGVRHELLEAPDTVARLSSQDRLLARESWKDFHAGSYYAELAQALAARGVGMTHVTLHVGAGTFLPVKVDDVREHKMHAEWGEITETAAAEINATRARGGRIIPVGTTALRLVESAARDDRTVEPWIGETDIFITPGFRFRVSDALMTNFHLPKSTLMMLVSAFMGPERIHGQ